MPSPDIENFADPKNISINWTDITSDLETGRDPIIYYQVQYRS
jgi:hypothetical protein